VQYDATDLYVEELLSKVGANKKTVKFAEKEETSTVVSH
jgi:hypothetical protein